MGRRGYPAEFRRKVLDLLASGRHVTDLARDLGISSAARKRIREARLPGQAATAQMGISVGRVFHGAQTVRAMVCKPG